MSLKNLGPTVRLNKSLRDFTTFLNFFLFFFFFFSLDGYKDFSWRYVCMCVCIYVYICAHMYVEGVWIYELTLSLLNIDRLTYNS